MSYGEQVNDCERCKGAHWLSAGNATERPPPDGNFGVLTACPECNPDSALGLFVRKLGRVKR